ncbi:MAG: hypothetical protein Q7P63_10850 [Verrucomicrobiota bacterium JB022]|nr:hypothetical protein [Verrucomicrobiota bacterium JB022]
MTKLISLLCTTLAVGAFSLRGATAETDGVYVLSQNVLTADGDWSDELIDLVSAIGTAGHGTIVIDEPVDIAQSVTIGSKVKLRFENGGRITVTGAGTKLTLNGLIEDTTGWIIDADISQLEGRMKAGWTRPDWFGVVQNGKAASGSAGSNGIGDEVAFAKAFKVASMIRTYGTYQVHDSIQPVTNQNGHYTAEAFVWDGGYTSAQGVLTQTTVYRKGIAPALSLTPPSGKRNKGVEIKGVLFMDNSAHTSTVSVHNNAKEMVRINDSNGMVIFNQVTINTAHFVECLYSTEMWDSRFINCYFNQYKANSSLPTKAAVRLGKGENETTNQIIFDSCVFERFQGTALRIEGGGAYPSANHIILRNTKMEGEMRAGRSVIELIRTLGVYFDGCTITGTFSQVPDGSGVDSILYLQGAKGVFGSINFSAGGHSYGVDSNDDGQIDYIHARDVYLNSFLKCARAPYGAKFHETVGVDLDVYAYNAWANNGAQAYNKGNSEFNYLLNHSTNPFQTVAWGDTAGTAEQRKKWVNVRLHTGYDEMIDATSSYGQTRVDTLAAKSTIATEGDLEVEGSATIAGNLTLEGAGQTPVDVYSTLNSYAASLSSLGSTIANQNAALDGKLDVSTSGTISGPVDSDGFQNFAHPISSSKVEVLDLMSVDGYTSVNLGHTGQTDGWVIPKDSPQWYRIARLAKQDGATNTSATIQGRLVAGPKGYWSQNSGYTAEFAFGSRGDGAALAPLLNESGAGSYNGTYANNDNHRWAVYEETINGDDYYVLYYRQGNASPYAHLQFATGGSAVPILQPVASSSGTTNAPNTTGTLVWSSMNGTRQGINNGALNTYNSIVAINAKAYDVQYQGYKLYVGGKIYATELVTDQATYADFVFEPGYPQPNIREWEAYIAEHGHLPNVPSAEETKEGIPVSQLQQAMLRKIEELTLILIEQDKEIQALREKLQ